MQCGHASAAIPAFLNRDGWCIGSRSAPKARLVQPTDCRGLARVRFSFTFAAGPMPLDSVGKHMNDLRLKAFDFNQALARAGLRLDAQSQVQPAQASGQGGFQLAMADALKSVSAAQNQAQGLQRELALGNPTVSVEQTMIAMTKAQVGFQATLQVRNRLAQAYSEIMSMQV